MINDNPIQTTKLARKGKTVDKLRRKGEKYGRPTPIESRKNDGENQLSR